MIPTVSGADLSIVASKTYLDNGKFPVSVTLKLNNSSDPISTRTMDAVIANVAPVMAFLPDIRINPTQQPIGQRRNIAFQTSFTDVGLLDTHGATVNWGDATTIDGTATVLPQIGATPGQINKSHQYAANGTYTVVVTVNDDDGGFHTRNFTATIQDDIPDVLPISVDSIIELDLSNVNADASYNNELGFFIVQDAAGLVGGKYPKDVGYAAAAINHASRHIVLPKDWVQVFKESPATAKPSRKFSAYVDAGSFLSFYAIQNNTTAWWTSANPT